MNSGEFLQAVWDWTVAIFVLIGSSVIGAFIVADLSHKFFSHDDDTEGDAGRHAMSGVAWFFIIVFILSVIVSACKTFTDCFLFKMCW